MRKTYKKVISLCAVLIFALAMIPTPAHALGDPFTAVTIGIGGASGAGLFGSMALASGIDISYASGTDPVKADVLWNDLYPGVSITGNKGQVTEPDPVTGIPTVYDYISVDIGDWLTAQQDYIDNFVSTYNVTDNSSDTFSKSYKMLLSCIPLYNNGTRYQSKNYPTNYRFSSTVWLEGYPQGSSQYVEIVHYSGTNSTAVCNFQNPTAVYFFQQGGQTPEWRITNGSTFYGSSLASSSAVSNVTTSGSWTSGTVDTSVFDSYSTPRIKIPASSWTPSDPDNWNVAEYLEELTVKLLAGQTSDIIIDDEDNPGPVPPGPVPSTPLGDIPTDEWYDLFGLPVLEGQEEIHQDLQDFSDSVSDGIDDVIGELEDIESDVESIDTNLGIGNGLLGDLKSIGQSIQSTLSSILSGVTDLVQEIVLSTETFIAGLLNSIMGGLGGWLSTMREAFSIWHYVVEWVGSISTVFSWFWSVAGSTSYYIQLPIYASLAGAVVLAFYKRFGK